MFEEFCRNGRLEISKWLHDIGLFEIDQLDLSDLITDVCESGYLEITQWLYGLSDVAVSNKAFHLACKKGRLPVAKWLVDCGADVDTGDNYSFRKSCKYGHLETAQWLYSIGAWTENIIEQSCKNGQLEIAKWLYSLDTDVNLENLFLKACKNGQLEIAKWLYSLDDKICFNDSFKSSCSKGHIRVSMWLYDLCPELLEKYFFYARKSLLKYAGISKDTIKIIQCIETGQKFPKVESVDEILIHALGSHHRSHDLMKLSLI